MVRLPIYLDYNATTPVDPRVVERMLPFFTDRFGNPASSSHSFGWQAQEAVEQARRDVATLIGAAARDIVFTSGATESNNLALRGIADLAGPDRRHVVVSAIEHKSVLEAARRLEREQWTVTVVPVQPDGRVGLDALRAAVTDATALVSVMAANNEIGVIQPLAAIGQIAHARGALVHVDGAQAAGKVPRDVEDMPIDLTGSFDRVDLAILTDEVKPPNTSLTGTAAGTVSVRYTTRGLESFALNTVAPDGLSLNRSLVSDLLQSEKFLAGVGQRVAEKAMDELLGSAPQRPFDSGRLNIELDESKIQGTAELRSVKTRAYNGLNLTINLDMDQTALADALALLEQSKLGNVDF